MSKINANIDVAERIATELEMLRKLKILELVGQGVRQGQIAAALGIAESTLSTMFPKGLLKELKKGS